MLDCRIHLVFWAEKEESEGNGQDYENDESYVARGHIKHERKDGARQDDAH